MTRTHDFAEFARCYGNGSNLLRDRGIVQPLALQVGDILATGNRLLLPPEEGYNGSVSLLFTGRGFANMINVAARIPLAILTEKEKARHIPPDDDVPLNIMRREPRFSLPLALRKGDIIGTGDEILDDPVEINWREVGVRLTGGYDGHFITVFPFLPLALLEANDPAIALLRL